MLVVSFCHNFPHCRIILINVKSLTISKDSSCFGDTSSQARTLGGLGVRAVRRKRGAGEPQCFSLGGARKALLGGAPGLGPGPTWQPGQPCPCVQHCSAAEECFQWACVKSVAAAIRWSTWRAEGNSLAGSVRKKEPKKCFWYE